MVMREWDGNRLVQKYTVSCYCNKETVQLRESATEYIGLEGLAIEIKVVYNDILVRLGCLNQIKMVELFFGISL